MYKLEPLSYTYCALEPFIDTHTLALHHLKHQRNYLNNLNALLVKNNYSFNYSLEELTKHINEFNILDRKDILYNLGGVINHNIYFKSISPIKEKPNQALMLKIINKFTSYENFLKKFKEMAKSIKGSGYTFLVLNNNELEIINLTNQKTPYYYNLIPLLGIDMWEHAYYINYENKKDIYIDNFFNIMSFRSANNYFVRSKAN